MKDEKHTKIDDKNLSMLIGSALKLEESRRDELSEFPPGHPLRVAMENAKKRFEEQQEKEKEQAEFRKRKKARKAKKVESKKEREEKENRHKAALKNIKNMNDILEEMVGMLEHSEKEVKKIASNIEDIPEIDLKLVRLKRVLNATKRGILETRVDPRQIKMEN